MVAQREAPPTRSSTLSLTIQSTALCARRAASYLDRRHHAASFVSSKGDTCVIYWWRQTLFPFHWNWAKVIGWVTGGWPRSNNSSLAGLKWCAIGNVMASDGMKTGKGWGRYNTIKPNRDNRITFTYQFPKPKRKEQRQHLILLTRAKFTLLIRVIKSKEGVALSTK